MLGSLPFEITERQDNLSNAEYHSHGANIISSSFVKTVCKRGSVAHALIPFEANKEALAFGTAFHDFRESEEDFYNNYYVLDDDEICKEAINIRYKKGLDTKSVRQTTEYKNLSLGAKREADKRTIITPNVLSAIKSMSFSVDNNRVFKEIVDSCHTLHVETSFFGNVMGIPVRVRPDVHGEDIDGNIVMAMDYKTCQSVAEFKWDFKKYRYDVQDVFYSDFLGIPCDNFYFVAVEKTSPYQSQVFTMSEKTEEWARRDLENALHLIKAWKDWGDDGLSQDQIVYL